MRSVSRTAPALAGAAFRWDAYKLAPGNNPYAVQPKRVTWSAGRASSLGGANVTVSPWVNT